MIKTLFRNILLSAALLPVLAHAQWFTDAAVEIKHSDNLSRSAKNGAVDNGISAGLSTGYHWQPGNFTGVNFIAGAEKTLWNSYSGMNQLSLSVEAGLSHKFGIGRNVPVLNIDLGLTRDQFNWDKRDTTAFTFNASITKRMTDRLLLTMGLAYEDVDGRNSLSVPPPGFSWASKAGDVWDYNAWTISTSAEYDLGPASWLSGNFSYRNGDIISTGIIYTANPGVIACTWDPAFGPMSVAYRLAGRTRSISLDFNQAIFSNATFFAGVEYINAFAESGIDYNSGAFRSGFIYSF